MPENTEKKPRRKLTLADRVAELDRRIAAAEDDLIALREKRDGIIADARKKAEDIMLGVQKVAGGQIAYTDKL